MRATTFKSIIKKAGFAASILLMASGVSFGQTVNLTAAPSTTMLPDGQIVPMWGYSCGTVAPTGATCVAANPATNVGGAAAGGWSPVVITVPYNAAGTSLTINLTNSLSFTAGTGTNTVPTSLVIVGQLGGGLGGVPTKTDSPAHAALGASWPAAGGADATTCVPGAAAGAAAAAATFCPPAQPQRVQSFATEVAATGATLAPGQVVSGSALTWTNLRPGTYLIESGTHPSIQGPMGLYGVLVVTTAPVAGTAGCGYPGTVVGTCALSYDADVAMALSEIDPVQNRAVAAAVVTAGFLETRVWSGQPGQCGDPAAVGVYNTCYPPAVNYDPRYYLINGISFDRTNLAASTIAALATTVSSIPNAGGNLLLRLVNAGLRMHVPSVVNNTMTLFAEDGNLLPGVPRKQSEVFLAAGKTYDVAIQPAQVANAYTAANYPVFDRQLSLSTSNQRDGGMQAYVAVAGGATSGVGTQTGSGAVLSMAAKTYYCVSGQTLAVTDPLQGLLGGSTGANGVALAATTLPATAALSLQSDGTFTYTPPATGPCGATFSYLVNGLTTSYTATITQCDASTNSVGTCLVGGAPVANPDTYTSTVGPTTLAARLHIAPPGVLANDTDPTGLPLTVDTTTVTAQTGLTVTAQSDGSFTASATAPGTYTFTYQAKNSQGTLSAAAVTGPPAGGGLVTVIFPAPSNLAVKLLDSISGQPITSQDYRWIIEEDRTFYVDPKCQINSIDPLLRPTTCPPLPVQSLGYNFHTANMPVIATGCFGPVSCEAGQTLSGSQPGSSGVPVACDQGNGVCRPAAQKEQLDPSQVALDSTKRYYLSVQPADGINPTITGHGGTVQVDPNCTPTLTTTCAKRPMRTSGGTNNVGDCTDFTASVTAPGNCGHTMGGAQISGATVLANGATPTQVNIKLNRTPLPTAQIAVFVFQDDYPLNGENDASGVATSGPAPNEAGLDSFNIVLFDQAGGLGDNTGQPTYDMFNQPLTNSLAGTIDPLTGKNACPLTKRADNLIGMIPVCPKYEDGVDALGQPILSPLAGQAIIKNLYPGLYEVQAMPGADRIARGEEWLQTNTLDGGKPHEAFIRPDEPGYFQEFGPGGFHVSIGFANPKIINDRKHNDAGTGMCDSIATGGGGATCNANLYGQVTGTHMSRTPDQRTFSSGDYSMYSFTQCYVGLGGPDGADFGLAKCHPDGTFQFIGIPPGDYKLSVFDQWNDIMLDGLVNQVCAGSHNYNTTGANGLPTTTPAPCSTAGVGESAANPLVIPVTQWRTNLYTRTFLDIGTGTPGSPGYGDGVSNLDTSGNTTEPGLTLVSTNIRYRDGSFGFFNNTDLNGFAGWNEVFPFMNWLVAETTSTRYKQTGTHTVYDAGGPVDGTPGGGTSTIAGGLANTIERVSLPAALRVPGAVYCTSADCTGQSIATGPYYTVGGSSGPTTGALSSARIDPPQPWGTTMAFQSLLGQSVFMEFGMRPMPAGENGGIQGHVVYTSTRPYDDPALLLQQSWEPLVPRVKINLYQEGTDPSSGQKTLKLVDTTTTTSFDDWAQGFRRDPVTGNLVTATYTYTDAGGITKTVTGAVPNMNCPGQDPTSPFFQTLRGSSQWLDPSNPKTPLAADSLFKCYDGWSQLNQVQPAPYDGKYNFPSIIGVDPVTGRPAGVGKGVSPAGGSVAGTNCTICTTGPVDGTPMLPVGKYVVEVIVPPGFELVKEEDKNILMGDTYIAPVTQQFAGFGNVFILPDQAAINAAYNKNNPVNATTNLGSTPALRHEGDTGSIESYWPCVGAQRVVPDYLSLFPGVKQTAPFAGATRPLCDRKEVILEDQSTVLAKFYVFTPAHIAGHFTGTITNDFASEFDPFSPQFGEKFGPPNLPVGLRDFAGTEVGRVYSDQWGIYNGMYFSSWEVNPPNPTGYAPQMAIACMNDPGPIPRTNAAGQYLNAAGLVVASADLAQMITDPSYNPAYSNFCYETPFMPGFTAYMDTPVIPTQAFADGYNLPDSEYPDGTPAIDSVIGSSVAGPWVSGAGQTITINCLGYNNADKCSKVVQNPDFSGPGATTSPYNQKTITRHYGFGSAGTVTIGGITATCGTWTSSQLSCTVPANVPACSLQQILVSATGTTPAVLDQQYCGELVITNAVGQRSIDAVTVTIGGKTPTYVSPTTTVLGSNPFGTLLPNPIQNAIDNALPGDLIIVGPGTYKEHVLMWKPVRLQGVGAASVTINADAHPSGSLDSWRREVTCLFGFAINGAPFRSADVPANTVYDPTGQYSCPDNIYLRSDRIPFEPIVGWDAAGNANLAQVLQEPTLMGAYEGAGITVLGRGIRIPNTDWWGIQAALLAGIAGAFPDGSVYLSASAADCLSKPTVADGTDYGTSNFLCNPSRIDGLSITNSSQGGGAIFMHGWNHNLEIGNTRIFGNHGTLTGGINLGNGETPGAYQNDGTLCSNIVPNPIPVPRPLCPPIPTGTIANELIPLQINTHVRVHHNAIYSNAGIGDALFSGTPSGAGGVTISTGADYYRLDHNWIAANLSTGDGGGVEHSGQSYFGSIDHNYILFNQSTNPTLPTNGGGIGIIGANNPRLLNGVECGTTTDADCPPGLGDGTGKGLVIDSNLILGNSAESGSGGGIRLQQVNGVELTALPLRPDRWYDVKFTNNIIANNVAGWDGAGISMEDAFKVSVINNTIASNDTTASAGVLFKTLAAIHAASPPPGCTPTTDPMLPQNQNCLIPNAAHVPQPAGLVTMKNTPSMNDALNGVDAICPSGYGYTGGLLGTLIDANCKTVATRPGLSIPLLVNNIFWQNRAFHVEITGPGSNLISQQNLVAMVPVLNQTSTGFCATTGLGANLTSPANVFYWDVGVRDDVVPNDGLGGARLTLTNSIYTPASGLTYAGTGNQSTGVTLPLHAQYCNGSRAAPENNGNRGGFLSPPGSSETTGLAKLFTFNNIQPAATVDEGHNWINLTYGPLTLASTVNAAFATAGTGMFLSSPQGPTLGAYSIESASAAVNGGNNAAAPALDFFGNPRPRTTANAADIGAVEYLVPNVAVAVVTPASLSFAGTVAGTTSPAQTLTLRNNGGAALTGIAVTVTAPFSQPAGGTCLGTLAAGARCTINVVYTAPATAGATSNGMAIIVASVAVINSPVALTGSAAARTFTATVGPSPLAFDNWATGTTSNTLNVDVLNTGNSPLTGLTYTFGAATPFTRAGGTCTPTLAVGAACTVNVRFASIVVGAATGTLTVTGTGATITLTDATPGIVQLTGTGVAARATVSVLPNPLTITLPSTGPGLSATTETAVVTLTNTAPVGNGASMTVTGVAATQPALTGLLYSWAIGGLAGPNTCTGTTLAPGQSCTVTVRFTNLLAARGTTVRTGTITFTDSGAASPQVGQLIGIASQAVVAFRDVTASPTVCAATGAGITSLAWATAVTPKTVCVVNTGNGDLNVGALGAVVGGSAQFSKAATQLGTACTAGTTLTPGQFCTAVINRARPVAGNVTGTLTVNDTGAAAATQVLTLTGN